MTKILQVRDVMCMNVSMVAPCAAAMLHDAMGQQHCPHCKALKRKSNATWLAQSWLQTIPLHRSSYWHEPCAQR